MPPKRARNGTTPARDMTSSIAPTPSRSSRRVADKVKTQQAIRPFVPAKQSYAYGSPGRMVMPGRLDNKLGAQSAAQVLKKAVDVSQARPAPQPVPDLVPDESDDGEEDGQGSDGTAVEDEDGDDEIMGEDEEEEDEDDHEDGHKDGDSAADYEEENEADAENEDDLVSPRTRTHPFSKKRGQATPSFRIEQPLAADFESSAKTPALLRRRDETATSSKTRILQPPEVPAWIRELDPRVWLPARAVILDNSRRAWRHAAAFSREAPLYIFEQIKLLFWISFLVWTISEGLPYIANGVSELPGMLPSWNYTRPEGLNLERPTTHIHHTHTQTQTQTQIQTRTLTVEASGASGWAEKFNKLENRLSSVEAAQTKLLSKPMAVAPRGAHQVNYFAVGSGMVVDPYLTSPTHAMSNIFKDKDTGLLARINPFQKPSRKPFTPAVAFSSWDDIGECWCAAESEGRAQIGVILSQEIYPTEIVVEHISKNATPDIRNAPKQMEVWVQVLDNFQRTKARHASLEMFDEQGQTAAEKSALDETWVKIAAFQYEIDADSNVQPFKMNVSLAEIGVHIDRIVVRSRCSWGSKFVCFYRLKLHGIPKPEPKPREPPARLDV